MPKYEFPQNKEYELSLLLDPAPGFKKLKEYLDSYIKLALDKFVLSQDTYDRICLELHEDISVAADKYLKSKSREKSYKFSTYFSWYLSERVNKIHGIKRKL
ncbi:MAG TPA: hypothetical protein VG347_10605 [Verrucomicrobiae bacterium]|nr:hypothetical protein [Verrucomicrobiae bacterium]